MCGGKGCRRPWAGGATVRICWVSRLSIHNRSSNHRVPQKYVPRYAFPLLSQVVHMGLGRLSAFRLAHGYEAASIVPMAHLA